MPLSAANRAYAKPGRPLGLDSKAPRNRHEAVGKPPRTDAPECRPGASPGCRPLVALLPRLFFR